MSSTSTPRLLRVPTLGVLCLAALVAAATPPDPDTSAMEPQVAEALQAARRQLLAAPEEARLWGEYGRLLHAHGIRAEASACYDRAAELSPEEARWSYLAGLALEEDAEPALVRAQNACRLDPGYAPAHLLAGRLEEQLGQRVAARDDYRRALDADPGSAAAEFGLGRLALADGDVTTALLHLERARARQPRSGSVLAILARAYRRAGRADEAEHAARLAADLPDELPVNDPLYLWVEDAAVSSTGLEKRAARAESSRDVLAAESLYRRLAGLRPDDARAQFNLGFALYRYGKPAEAEAPLQRAIRLDPGLARAHLILGGLLLGRGQIVEGLRHFEVPTLTAEHAEFFVDLAGALQEDGHLELAAYFVGKAAGLDPRSPDAHRRFGQILSRQGKLNEAVAQFETAIELGFAGGDVHVDLAIALARMGRHADAWAQIRVARSQGTSPPADFLGWLRQRMPEPGP